jgi:D-3-phosphoglycerate dehydrogenase
MKKVLIPTKLNAVARETLEEHGGYTVVQDEQQDLLALCGEHPDTYALLVRSEPVTPEVIDALPALKVIIRAGAGYNTIDTRYARKRGIDVMNTPGANANAVAEEVIALMLADARHLVHADPSARNGDWEKKRFMGREISHKTVGIVGLGYIGKTLAKRLSGFDVRLLGYDPVISEERARDLDVELVDLPSLFAESDYVSLHVPEIEETRGMVGADLLNRMKKGATLINCARAGVLVEDDLRRAKEALELRFLNDVYPKDEPGPKSVADVADIMVPHLGASTAEANYNAAFRSAEQLIEFDEKGITSYIVNRDIPAGLDEAYGELAYLLTRLCRRALGGDTKLKLIETSFYGGLKPYADWLLVPIVSALSEDFDRSMDQAAARRFLQDMGVEYEDRETDDRKGYHNSITVDLTTRVSSSHLTSASVRGTVAEGNLMVARINDYDKLYFEPTGHAVFFEYRDRPGVLGRIGKALAEAGINIDDVRNPHDSKGEYSIAIIRVNQAVGQDVVDRIAADIEARMAFAMSF